MPKAFYGCVQQRWTGDYIAQCPKCGKDFRAQKVKRGQIRFCSSCGREDGVLSYQKEMEDVPDERVEMVHTAYSWTQLELIQCVLGDL